MSGQAISKSLIRDAGLAMAFHFTSEHKDIIKQTPLSKILNEVREKLPEGLNNFDDYIKSAAADITEDGMYFELNSCAI